MLITALKVMLLNHLIFKNSKMIKDILSKKSVFFQIKMLLNPKPLITYLWQRLKVQEILLVHIILLLVQLIVLDMFIQRMLSLNLKSIQMKKKKQIKPLIADKKSLLKYKILFKNKNPLKTSKTFKLIKNKLSMNNLKQNLSSRDQMKIFKIRGNRLFKIIHRQQQIKTINKYKSIQMLNQNLIKTKLLKKDLKMKKMLLLHFLQNPIIIKVFSNPNKKKLFFLISTI